MYVIHTIYIDPICTRNVCDAAGGAGRLLAAHGALLRAPAGESAQLWAAHEVFGTAEGQWLTESL